MANLLTQRRIFRRARPDWVPGLALWYDSADSASVGIVSGTTQNLWRDKSGFAYNLSQSTPSLQTQYGTQFHNGIPLVVTSNTGDGPRLVTGSIPSSHLFGPNRNAGTQFRAMRFVGGTLPGGFHRFDAAFIDTVIWRTDQFHEFIHGGVSDTANTIFGSNWFVSEMAIYAAVYDIANQQVRLWRNGRPFVTLALSSAAAFNSVPMTWKNNWDAAYSTIHEGEMIHFNRVLAAEEFAAVNNYLSAKWGVS